MQDNYVSRAAVIAYLLWATTLVLVVVVWLIALAHPPHVVHRSVGVMAIVSGNVAGVWQIRLYMMRLSGLIRVTNGLESPDADVRPLARR
jgi:hypothetical protein